MQCCIENTVETLFDKYLCIYMTSCGFYGVFLLIGYASTYTPVQLDTRRVAFSRAWPKNVL